MTLINRPRLVIAAAFVLFASSVLAVQIGEPAPDFTRIGNDGASYTLSDVFGERVQLLNFVGFS